MNTFELEIRKRLLEGKSQSTIVERMIEESLDNPKSLMAVAHFAINTGHHYTLAKAFPTWLRRAPKVPWGPLMELIALARVSPEKLPLKKIEEGATAQNCKQELFTSSRMNRYIQRFAEGRQLLQRRKLKDLEKRRQNLHDKLTFLSSQRLIDQEGEALLQLEREFPEDPQIPSLKKDYSERWARGIVARGLSHSGSEPLSTTTLSDEEKAFVDLLKAECLRRAQQSPHLAYNLSLIFHFMDSPTEALEVLELAPPSEAKSWLYIDYLFQSRHLISCLDELSRLEIQFATDPEAAFSISYMRSRVLWGLEQKDRAIQMMKQIVQLRPYYRAAASLLNEWTQERGLNL